jgi:hypothetical protein
MGKSGVVNAVFDATSLPLLSLVLIEPALTSFLLFAS